MKMSNILYSLLAMVGGHESPTPPGPAAGAQIVQPRTGILKDMLALTREPVHCCSWVICTAAVVAFLRLRRLFVSGVFLSGFTACVRARAQRQPLCVLWHAWSSCAKPDYMCVRGVCRAAAAAVLGCDVVFVRRAGFFFAHVSLLGKCMPHEHPHDRRSAFLDSGSNVWAERIHCCIKGVCTAAVVAFLRLRRVFVSGVRPLAVSRHMCALELLPAAAVVRFFWHAGSSACTNDNICAFGCL